MEVDFKVIDEELKSVQYQEKVTSPKELQLMEQLHPKSMEDDIAIAEAINEVEDELRQNTSDSNNNIIYYVITSSIIIVIAGVVASFLM